MNNRKARKEHICTLCYEIIPKGTTYKYHDITPWDHPDNDTFGVFKAHLSCNQKWNQIGQHYDWLYPQCRQEWMEMLNG